MFKVKKKDAGYLEESFGMAYKALTEDGQFGNQLAIEKVYLKKEKRYEPHFHKVSEAFLYFIEGTGYIIDEFDNKYEYSTGDSVFFPAKTKHGFFANTDTIFLTVQYPPIFNAEHDEEDFHF